MRLCIALLLSLVCITAVPVSEIPPQPEAEAPKVEEVVKTEKPEEPAKDVTTKETTSQLKTESPEFQAFVQVVKELLTVGSQVFDEKESLLGSTAAVSFLQTGDEDPLDSFGHFMTMITNILNGFKALIHPFTKQKRGLESADYLVAEPETQKLLQKEGGGNHHLPKQHSQSHTNTKKAKKAHTLHPQSFLSLNEMESEPDLMDSTTNLITLAQSFVDTLSNHLEKIEKQLEEKKQ